MRLKEDLPYTADEDVSEMEETVSLQSRYSNAHQRKVVVVGYALTSKKTKSFMKPKLEGLARYNPDSAMFFFFFCFDLIWFGLVWFDRLFVRCFCFETLECDAILILISAEGLFVFSFSSSSYFRNV